MSAELEFESRMFVLLAYNFCPSFKRSHLRTEVLIISQRIPSLSCSWDLAFAVLSKGREVEQRTGHSRSLVPSMPFLTQILLQRSSKHSITPFSLPTLYYGKFQAWNTHVHTPMYIHPCMYPPSRFYNEDFAGFLIISISSYLYSSTWSI